MRADATEGSEDPDAPAPGRAWRILLVGAGALGSSIALGLAAMPAVKLAVFDVDLRRSRELAQRAGAAAPDVLDNALQEADLVIEAASQEALRQLAPRVLGRGRPLIALSSGALVDDAFLADVARLASERGGRLYVPSGAIGALDAIRAAMEAGLDEVTLVTAKPPAGFGLSDVREPRVLYDGPAREAVKLYPKNVNVAAALSLAGIGFDRTRVRIVADPALTANTHTIEARGAFGALTFRVENRPSPDNPASSHLASLAALALVRRLLAPVTVGT
ncbi:MAG TPA: aspartate dehydrogenase [Candidatus Thermoplasmatota archaeon]|nr:aspartate dehydrogenase [Candidatus Thermoplasmatota archaeon]